MALRELLLPWELQPQEAAGLSTWARSEGFRELMLPGLYPRGMQGVLTANGGGGTRSSVPTPYGTVRRIVSGAEYYLDGGALDPRSGYLWVMRCAASAIGNWGGYIARTSDNGTTSSWTWQRYGSEDRLVVYHGGTMFNLLPSGLSSLLDGAMKTCVGGWDGSTLFLYVDGSLVASIACTTAPTYTAGTGQIKLLGSRDVFNATGDVAAAAFAIGRGPTAELAHALAGDGVWALFEERRILVAVSAASIPAALVLTESGSLAHKAAPSASDRRLFLAADGSRIAATSQPTGTRPLSLSGGAWHAGSAS